VAAVASCQGNPYTRCRDRDLGRVRGGAAHAEVGRCERTTRYEVARAVGAGAGDELAGRREGAAGAAAARLLRRAHNQRLDQGHQAPRLLGGIPDPGAPSMPLNGDHAAPPRSIDENPVFDRASHSTESATGVFRPHTGLKSGWRRRCSLFSNASPEIAEQQGSHTIPR
jgi:hypothetical protein